MSIAPIPKAPGARGGPAVAPVKLSKPSIPKPGSPGWKSFTQARYAANHPVQPAAPHVTTPVEEAMSAYRQAVAALGTAVAPVDTAAIHAPYAQAEQTTGQLGQGYGQMLQQSGDAASGQYTGALNAAQQAAAQFGISAGSGANPTQLQNNGAAPIAAQTQANTASAAAATNQWQRLLAQAEAGKEADATTARQGALDTARAGLAANIPTLIGNSQDRAFQAKAQSQNMGLAYTQLDAKQKSDLASEGIDIQKLAQQGKEFDVTAWLKQRGQDVTASHNKVTEGQGAAKIKQGARALDIKQTAAQKKATSQGIKGISQVNSILKTTASKSGTTTKAAGWDVLVQALDPDTGDPTGNPTTLKNIKDARASQQGMAGAVPKNFRIISSTPATRKVATSTAGTGVTLATWNRALAILKSQNPGVNPSQLVPLLPAKPAK